MPGKNVVRLVFFALTRNLDAWPHAADVLVPGEWQDWTGRLVKWTG